jgi:hypothetical protein
MTVKREHVALLAYVWLDMVPAAYAGISPEDAQQAWKMFTTNPADPNLANAKRMANELWMLHIQGN